MGEPENGQPVGRARAAGTVRSIGRGSVTVTPDQVRSRIALEVRAETPSAALAGVRDSADAVQDALTAFGIRSATLDPDDRAPAEPAAGVADRSPRRASEVGWVGSHGLHLGAAYDYGDTGPRFVGYDARLTLDIVAALSDRLGDMLSAALDAAGPNGRIDSLEMGVGDVDERRREARRLAVSSARRAAADLADAAGRRLGVVVSVEEVDTAPSPAGAMELKVGAGPDGPPLPVGVQQLDSTVVMIAELTDPDPDSDGPDSGGSDGA